MTRKVGKRIIGQVVVGMKKTMMQIQKSGNEKRKKKNMRKSLCLSMEKKRFVIQREQFFLILKYLILFSEN